MAAFHHILSIRLTVTCILLTMSLSSGTLHAQRLPVDKSLIEMPAVHAQDSIIRHTGYTSNFNTQRMIPNWVAYELTSAELNGQVRRPSNSPFQPDPDFMGPQPDRSDYSYSGWDKGHMAPAADMKWSDMSMYESFYFINVCPQDHDFNAGDWEKLEEKARSIARQNGTLWVTVGPIITESQYGTLGENHVVIPDAFFKAFLMRNAKGEWKSIAFVMPNESTHHALGNYALTVNDLEETTGIDLFTNLEDDIEEQVESQLNLKDWGIQGSPPAR